MRHASLGFVVVSATWMAGCGRAAPVEALDGGGSASGVGWTLWNDAGEETEESGADATTAETSAEETSSSDGDPTGVGTTTGTSTTTDTGTTGSTGESTTGNVETSTGSDSGPRFDLGVQPDLPPEQGCTKVDLLFVIDNSGSMANEQDQLVASFPGFVEKMREALVDAHSYHVGVVTTDGYAANEVPCRGVLGALVTRTSTAGTCGPFLEGRFMTERDELETEFACSARVGEQGNAKERPIAAMLAALEPTTAAAVCNQDFLRDDALLVVVLISDEDDAVSEGTPEEWVERLRAVKGGDPDRIVVVSVINKSPPNLCTGLKGDALRLTAFTESIGNGFIGDICAPDYSTVFQRAVTIIDTTCDGFNPP